MVDVIINIRFNILISVLYLLKIILNFELDATTIKKKKMSTLKFTVKKVVLIWKKEVWITIRHFLKGINIPIINLIIIIYNLLKISKNQNLNKIHY